MTTRMKRITNFLGLVGAGLPRPYKSVSVQGGHFMIYLAVLAFGVTLGLPIAVIFASRAQANAASTALEGIARQPDAAPQIQTAMIIGLALIESLVIYSLLMFFLLYNKLPEGEILKEMIDADAKRVATDVRSGN